MTSSDAWFIYDINVFTPRLSLGVLTNLPCRSESALASLLSLSGRRSSQLLMTSLGDSRDETSRQFTPSALYQTVAAIVRHAPFLLRTRATPTHVYRMAGREEKKRLVLALYEVGGVKFGHFTLKSGVQSPVYVDLRVMVAHPRMMVGGRGGGADYHIWNQVGDVGGYTEVEIGLDHARKASCWDAIFPANFLDLRYDWLGTVHVVWLC